MGHVQMVLIRRRHKGNRAAACAVTAASPGSRGPTAPDIPPPPPYVPASGAGSLVSHYLQRAAR